MEKFVNLRWSKTLEILFISVLGARLLAKLKAVTNEQSINAIYCFLFLIAVKFFIQVFINIKKRQQNQKTGIFGYFPAEIVAFFVFQGVLIQSFMQWLMRRKHVAIALTGKKISYMKNSQYGTAFIIALIMIFTDIPIGMLIVNYMTQDEQQKIIFHAVIGILSVYSIILILGDRRKIVHDTHFLSEEVLHLRIADRFSVDIAIDLIIEIRLFNEDIYKWKKANDIANESVLQVSPCIYTDKPNILITVEKNKNNIIHRFEKRSDIQQVLIFVDDPLALKNDIFNLMQRHHEAS